jgi:hypothetical protein
MGTTREESGILKVRNRPSFPVIYYPVLALTALMGFFLGSNAYTESTINSTLKMCNQRPLECKFKYDMVMYHETGKVPYTAQPVKK